MIKYSRIFFSLFFLITLLSGCTATFGGTLLVLSFGDIILYVVIAFAIAGMIYMKQAENKKRAFWISFILNLLLTPLVGFIWLLILFSKK